MASAGVGKGPVSVVHGHAVDSGVGVVICSGNRSYLFVDVSRRPVLFPTHPAYEWFGAHRGPTAATTPGRVPMAVDLVGIFRGHFFMVCASDWHKIVLGFCRPLEPKTTWWVMSLIDRLHEVLCNPLGLPECFPRPILDLCWSYCELYLPVELVKRLAPEAGSG